MTLKYKGLVITTFIFFLSVNTTFFWEGRLGIFSMPVTLILIVVYLGLLIALMGQLFLATREKFKERKRLIVITLVGTLLLLVTFKPSGLIDFDKLEGKVILLAQQEGAANCMTTFKLKENNKFVERNFCFGATEIKGNYNLINDTIFFENVKLARGQEEYYKFAIVRPSKFNKDNKHFELVRFKDLDDTIGRGILIIKDDLDNKILKKPNR